jgi:thioredoxin 1
MAGDVITINDESFRKEVLEAQEPVLVDFTAQWCAPCRYLAPTVEALATDYKGRVKVAKVDVDENQGVAEQYGIRSMPTLLFFKKGVVVGQVVGAVPRARLEEALRKVV